MRKNAQNSREINLVGSIPLENPESVFRKIASTLGHRVGRIPDGEIGPLRSKWILSQKPVFEAHPCFEPVPKQEQQRYSLAHAFQLSNPATEEIQLGPLGYASWAAESYAVFNSLRESVIHRACRFQVCIPTPLAVVTRLIAPRDQARVEIAYRDAMRREIEALFQSIPASDLALQVDVCNELGFIEGIWQSPIAKSPEALIGKVAELGDLVPAAAEFGYHLCYGDFGHRHFMEPKDLGLLVRVANMLVGGTARTVDWIHMPVPRERSDQAYFQPLRQLTIPANTSLFLGLIHITDGIEGTRKRMAAADAVVTSYGIATECGWGRRDPSTISELINLHAAL